jgi:hypothetical protein
MRLRVAHVRIEKVATLTGIRRATGAFGAWFGLDPGDALCCVDSGVIKAIALSILISSGSLKASVEICQMRNFFASVLFLQVG